MPDREGLLARTYRNPVYPEYFADPCVFRHEGWYYAVGTGDAGRADWAFPMLRSRDLAAWEPIGPALPRLSADLGTDYWAPEVACHDGGFTLYYSVGHGDRGHQLRCAGSDRPEGPYRDVARLSDPSCPFAIDASPFLGADGTWYLFYAIDLLDTDRPGTSLVVDRLADFDRLVGTPRVVQRASQDWQRFQANRTVRGEVYDWHTLEGPFAVEHGGRVYVFYSGGNWQNASYGVDYTVADTPMGPYDAGSSPLPRTLRTVPGKVLGPGHNTVVVAPDGESDVIVYHAWDVGMTARRMCIDPIVWTEDGPRCDGPTYHESALPQA